MTARGAGRPLRPAPAVRRRPRRCSPLASAACALAPGVGRLIAARAVQGAGAALLMPLGLALLSAAFPPRSRGAAIGIFSAITGLAVASGPLVGGAIVAGHRLGVDLLDQRPDRPRRRSRSCSRRCARATGPTPRSTSAASRSSPAAALGLVWGLVRGNQVGWGSAEVIGSLAGGVLLAVAFVAWELRAPRADAAAGLLPLARVLGRQRGDLLHVRVAVRRRVLLRPAAADRARLRPARRRPAAAAVDGDVHDGRAGRGRAGRPHRRAAADGRRADAAGGRAGLARR